MYKLHKTVSCNWLSAPLARGGPNVGGWGGNTSAANLPVTLTPETKVLSPKPSRLEASYKTCSSKQTPSLILSLVLQV